MIAAIAICLWVKPTKPHPTWFEHGKWVLIRKEKYNYSTITKGSINKKIGKPPPSKEDPAEDGLAQKTKCYKILESGSMYSSFSWWMNSDQCTKRSSIKLQKHKVLTTCYDDVITSIHL